MGGEAVSTRYAEGTGVSQQRTVEEVQRLLERLGRAPTVNLLGLPPAKGERE